LYKFNKNNIKNQYPAKKKKQYLYLYHVLISPADSTNTFYRENQTTRIHENFCPVDGWTNNPKSMQPWEVWWQFQEQQGIFKIFSGVVSVSPLVCEIHAAYLLDLKCFTKWINNAWWIIGIDNLALIVPETDIFSQ
jgi:hypothetical protein